MTMAFARMDLALPLIDAALAEDVGSGDATTQATVPADARAEAVILAKEEGVLCGLGVARAVFERVEPAAVFEALPVVPLRITEDALRAAAGWVVFLGIKALLVPLGTG